MTISSAVRTKIQAEVLNHFNSKNLSAKVNLHFFEARLPQGHRIEAGDLKIELKRDTAIVLADLHPGFNWSHPCEYHLYDPDNGDRYQTIPAHLPPSHMIKNIDKLTAFHTPVKLKDYQIPKVIKPNPQLLNGLSHATGQRYAVLYAGHANNRHTNDLEFLYRTLVDVYGFDTANIYVLNHDGDPAIHYFSGADALITNTGNWPGDNTPYRMAVTGQGTRAGMQAAFADLAARLQPEDFLLIHTNNHGGGPADETDYCLYAYDPNAVWVQYYVNDFVADLAALPQIDVLLVMMEQCRSGGFIDPILSNSPAKWTHVATAVPKEKNSAGGANFDPYARDWIAGLAGHYENGTTPPSQIVDTNGDGRLSALEVYNYAKAVKCAADDPRYGEQPGSCSNYIFVGLPAHDLFLRDNLMDHGQEPLIDGGISCSPDIILYNQELLDPEATLNTTAAQQSDTMGQSVEFGQDNYLYLRVHNRGTQPTSGTAAVYWCYPSTFPTPASWNLVGEIAIPAVPANNCSIVGPIVWKQADIPAKGHYCFVGLINSGNDPAPDKSTIHTYDDYYNFIRLNNNATWKNFEVVDMFKNSGAKLDFHIQGWPKVKISTDLMVDLTAIPTNVTVTLRMLKRLSHMATLENATLLRETGAYQKFTLQAGQQAFLKNISLKPSDSCEASLEFVIPETIADGNYRLGIAQLVDGKEMGRVSRLLAVGAYPYLANQGTHEIHIANCDWAFKVIRKNKVAYTDVHQAIRHGYNGCRFCLPEYNTD